MRDIEGAIELGAFVGWTHTNPKDKRNRFATSLQFLQDVSDEHEGFLFAASAKYFQPVSRPLTLTAGITLTYGSSDYMQTYFGVDANNAARSGLTQFSAGSGIRDIKFPLLAIYSLSPKWHLTGGAVISILTGDASDSPVVDDSGSSTQIYAGLGAVYAW
jgi:outer membrane scaffolding protein for murein synthesis (MipA/OmpV family)